MTATADPVARFAVSRCGTARDCNCPATLALCGAAVCPRRAIMPHDAERHSANDQVRVAELVA